MKKKYIISLSILTFCLVSIATIVGVCTTFKLKKTASSNFYHIRDISLSSLSNVTDEKLNLVSFNSVLNNGTVYNYYYYKAPNGEKLLQDYANYLVTSLHFETIENSHKENLVEQKLNLKNEKDSYELNFILTYKNEILKISLTHSYLD